MVWNKNVRHWIRIETRSRYKVAKANAAPRVEDYCVPYVVRPDIHVLPYFTKISRGEISNEVAEVKKKIVSSEPLEESSSQPPSCLSPHGLREAALYLW